MIYNTILQDNNENLQAILQALQNKAAGSGGNSGGNDVLDAVLDGSITEIENDRVTGLRDYAFYGCSSLTSISFPKCTNIGGSAFYSCDGLTSVSFPVCTKIEGYAFFHCSNLSSLTLPLCTDIGSYAFAVCSNLETASFPECINIFDNAFYGCSRLTTASFPACYRVGSLAFYGCRQLTTAYFNAVVIDYEAFRNCSNLINLTLTNQSVCFLTDTMCLAGTPIASGTGHVYVPSQLVSQYRAATQWAYYSSVIRAIGDTSISFSIDGLEYIADLQMTWNDWCHSAYNTGGLYCDTIDDGDIVVLDQDGFAVSDQNGNYVTAMDNIEPGYSYYMQPY